jgi:hypothetical protein
MRYPISLSLLLLSMRISAQDYIVCVDTVAELEDAVLVAASAIPFTRVIVRVEQGTYNLSSSAILRTTAQQPLSMLRSLQLLGGYTGGCAARVLNASNTILQNNGSKLLKWDINRDLKIQGFSFSSFDNPIDLENFEINDTEQSIDISNNRFIGGSGQIDLSVEAGSDLSLITFKNNQIYGRGTDTNCSLRIFGDNSADTVVRMVVSNNTFAGNGTGSADTLCFGFIDLPGFYNNIFYTNSGDDLKGSVSNGLVTALNNIYQSTSALSFALGGNLNNNANNPLFVDYPAGDLRLQNGSTASNSGFSNVPYGLGSFDVASKARVIGTSVDRGANESNNAGLFNLTVTNTNDAGTGSLREAITLANGTPGLNGVLFNIPGSSCPKVINLTSALPSITDDLVVDASSQPGNVPNTSDIAFNGERCVLLRGTGIGLRVPSAAASDIRLVVDSMAFGGFDFSIALQGGSGHIVRGSHFGVNLGAANNTGLVGVLVGANDVLIGGSGPDERNVFARQVSAGGFTGAGVSITSSALRTEVTNNYFGTEPNGVLPAENSYGIIVDGDDGQFDDNLIANSTQTALWLRTDARNNYVHDSRLGLPVICIGSCPTSSANARGFVIDGTVNRLLRNEIAFSQQQGVRVTDDDNAVSRNTVYGGPFLTAAIDIAGSGFTPNDNDALTPPAGNRGINYPVLRNASYVTNASGANEIKVDGTLDTINGSYTIDLYASDRSLGIILGSSNRCEGRQYLGSTTVSISNAPAGANGSASFSVNVDASDAAGRFITAQAVRRTVIDGALRLADSSEYGGCLDAPMFANGFE